MKKIWEFGKIGEFEKIGEFGKIGKIWEFGKIGEKDMNRFVIIPSRNANSPAEETNPWGRILTF